MKYKNIEIHNIGEIIPGEAEGSISWLRVPSEVRDSLESEQGKNMCCGATGVELRFIMKSDTVSIRMRTPSGKGVFHVYRGSIQGGWEDHEVDKITTPEFEDFVIKKSENPDMLERITNNFNYPFSPEVIRVVMDRGVFEIIDIIGDVEPPKAEQLPKKTLLAYGSSITHGSNSIDMSHSWVSVLAHNLKMDCINLGMAGSCRMEPEMVEYIASKGENGEWNMALLELGINVLDWDEEKIIQRVSNTLKQIAGRNPQKPIYVISPFYSFDDYNHNGKADKWRRLISQVINETKYDNVTYINGLDILGDMSLMSADEVHPNIYGVAQIAQRLLERIK